VTRASAAATSLGPRELGELRTKYEEMRRLRLAHEAGDPEPPREAMAALAARFPGALREIDELPLAEIHARIASLGNAEAGRINVTMWMEATSLFHAMTRGALSVKRWLAGRKHVDAETRAAFEAAAPTLSHADDARAWADDLQRIARPPRGRVTDLVYERIAAAMHVTPREARILVFGLTRRERKVPAGIA
jgi:hypothetical protein